MSTPLKETRHSRWMWMFGLSLAVLVTGCRTTSIKPERNIPAPPGLTQAQVQLAVLGAIVNQPKDNLPIGAAIADRALQAGLMGYRGLSADRHPWYYEGEDGDTIIAGFQTGSRYLQVRCRCTATSVGITIPKSEGFSQSRRRIHKKAYDFTEQLVARIRRSLGAVAQSVDHGNTATTTFNSPH